MKHLVLSILSAVFFLPLAAPADIFVKIPGFGDPSVSTPGYDNGEWFIADSFSFGVERELKESGDKGGTADINIGLGELQECTISKSIDRASARLTQFAINGDSCGTAEIEFVEVAADGKPAPPYLIYKLDRCFVKSWSTSGDADDRPTEEVAFYYNKIAFQYYYTDHGKITDGGSASWDSTANAPWPGHGIPKAPPSRTP